MTALILEGTVVGYAGLKDGSFEFFLDPRAQGQFDELWPPKLTRDGHRVSFGGRRGDQFLCATAALD